MIRHLSLFFIVHISPEHTATLYSVLGADLQRFLSFS